MYKQTLGKNRTNSNSDLQATSAKRVDLVTIKMVKESSIHYANRQITSAYDAQELLSSFLQDKDREALILCCLNAKNQPTCINLVSIGSLTSSLVHPREVFKAAILSNAFSIIIAHNHPSGNSSPSQEDYAITKRIQEAGKILGIPLLDHIIIGDNTYTSLKETGTI